MNIVDYLQAGPQLSVVTVIYLSVQVALLFLLKPTIRRVKTRREFNIVLFFFMQFFVRMGFIIFNQVLLKLFWGSVFAYWSIEFLIFMVLILFQIYGVLGLWRLIKHLEKLYLEFFTNSSK